MYIGILVVYYIYSKWWVNTHEPSIPTTTHHVLLHSTDKLGQMSVYLYKKLFIVSLWVCTVCMCVWGSHENPLHLWSWASFSKSTSSDSLGMVPFYGKRKKKERERIIESMCVWRDRMCACECVVKDIMSYQYLRVCISISPHVVALQCWLLSKASWGNHVYRWGRSLSHESESAHLCIITCTHTYPVKTYEYNVQLFERTHTQLKSFKTGM